MVHIQTGRGSVTVMRVVTIGPFPRHFWIVPAKLLYLSSPVFEVKMPTIAELIDVPARGCLTAPAEVWPDVGAEVGDHDHDAATFPGGGSLAVNIST